jgi:DNA-binding MarR family transcriptional regulator
MGVDSRPAAGFSAGIRLLARLSRLAETAFQETGISLPQYRLLVELAEGPRRASQVAAELGVTRPTLTSLVDGLERNGLLRRVPVAGDRRGVRLETTEAGQRALARAEATLAERLAPLVDAKSAARAGDMVSAIARALGGKDPRNPAAGA